MEWLMQFVRQFISSTGFFELILILLFAILGPWLLWEKADSERTGYFKSESRARLYSGAAIGLIVLDLLIVVFLGQDIWRHMQVSLGPTLRGFLVAAIICAVLLPVGYAGTLFRGVYLAAKVVRSDPTKMIAPNAKKKAIAAAGLLLASIVACFLFLPLKMAGAATFGIGLALFVGWAGSIMIPSLFP